MLSSCGKFATTAKGGGLRYHAVDLNSGVNVIVAPMCSGKSTTLKEFSLDIDDIPLSEECLLLREQAHETNCWDKYNAKYYSEVANHLKDKNVKCISVHGIDLAMLLNPRAILVVRPTRELFELNMEKRADVGHSAKRQIAEMNWGDTRHAYEFKDFDDLTTVVKEFLDANSVPIDELFQWEGWSLFSGSLKAEFVLGYSYLKRKHGSFIQQGKLIHTDPVITSFYRDFLDEFGGRLLAKPNANGKMSYIVNASNCFRVEVDAGFRYFYDLVNNAADFCEAEGVWYDDYPHKTRQLVAILHGIRMDSCYHCGKYLL